MVPTPGRIDTHAHLLPGVDDGCTTVADSIAAARQMVAAGYTDAFCTPHVPTDLSPEHPERIRHWTRQLQMEYDAARVGLKLHPGGELSLAASWPRLAEVPPASIITANLAGRFALFDFWADALPPELEPAVRHLVSLGMRPILAHPERIAAFQRDPAAIDQVKEWGCLLQMNTWCLTGRPGSSLRVTCERFLTENRYFMFGMDTHDSAGVPVRLQGLAAAADLVGWETVDRLTRTHPAQLLAGPPTI
jgi:protein-tyrosine phosphatase